MRSHGLEVTGVSHAPLFLFWVFGSLPVYYGTALMSHEKKQAGMFYLLSELASIKLMEPFSSLVPISEVPTMNTLKDLKSQDGTS